MAVSKYTVKRGDTLWGIATTYASSIPGSNTNAKIEYLRKINNIKDKDLIYVGQILKLSEGESSSSGSSGSSTSSTTSSQFSIWGFGLQSDDTSGRAMIVNWNEHNNNETAGYTVRWQQYLYGKWVGSDTDINHKEDMYCQSTFTADKSATKVKVQVRPYYKNKDGAITYWNTVSWSKVLEYDFSNNPPVTPDVPTVTIKDRTLTAYIENIDASKLDATCVKFNIVKNNTSSIHTSSDITINTTTNYVAYQYDIEYGSNYKVRCCSVSAKGKESGWSNFSSNIGTKPSAPSAITVYRRNKRADGSITAYLEWTAVTNAEYYVIEYVTEKNDFETAPGNIQETRTEDARTTIEVTDIQAGEDYFFRVRAARQTEGESDPSPIVTVPIGEPPAAPTTWSSSKSAFVGESMELNWTHNSRDGSTQTFANLGLKINNDDWITFVFTNTTNATTGDRIDTYDFTYGKAISYKGELHVELNTSHAKLKNAKIVWKVRTAGVTDEFSDTDWSTDRTIHIYERPGIALSVTNAVSGGSAIETLTSFPFYIHANVELESYEYQKPIGYYLRVVSNESYETVDNAGRTKMINQGDAVYSKYFDTDRALIVEMSASNVDLESGMRYTVLCSADMNNGLSIEHAYDFTVSWTDVEYIINATISVDNNTYAAVIKPYCETIRGALVENVTISVYRREYNGALTEIATDIPNNGTSVTDPHPSLDYARYRLVARDRNTGAISFYDMPGHRVGCTSVIIQWDEEWSMFETSDEYSLDVPPRSGSILILPYNVKISDNRKREVSRVAYAGREYPVSYHGTLISESSSWSTTIPKNDVETIYALRRLSLWPGSAYIREPSGMGFWANITPSFNVDYGTVSIPITLEVVRVEGGM